MQTKLWNHTITTVLRPFFRDHLGEPVPQENFWTLWCKARLTEADTLTIRLGASPSGLTSAHLHHPTIFFIGRMPFLLPNQQRQKALKAHKTVKHGYNSLWLTLQRPLGLDLMDYNQNKATDFTEQPATLHVTYARQVCCNTRAAATATVWRIGGKFTRTGLCCVRKLCIMSPGSIDWYQ